jgi:hypothetical protein
MSLYVSTYPESAPLGLLIPLRLTRLPAPHIRIASLQQFQTRLAANIAVCHRCRLQTARARHMQIDQDDIKVLYTKWLRTLALVK